MSTARVTRQIWPFLIIDVYLYVEGSFRTELVKHSVRVDEVAQNAMLTSILSNNIVVKGDAYKPSPGVGIDLRPPSERRSQREEELRLMAKKASLSHLGFP